MLLFLGEKPSLALTWLGPGLSCSLEDQTPFRLRVGQSDTRSTPSSQLCGRCPQELDPVYPLFYLHKLMPSLYSLNIMRVI